MRNPIISANIRVRHPEEFHVGEGSIIDDYSYFSTKVRIGRYSHIASCCTVAGGGERTFTLGDCSSISAGVRIWCSSDDFVHDLVTIIPAGFPPIKENQISADVMLANYTAVGANAVIMPGNRVPEGTAIGALSFVPAFFAFEPWTVYAGIPVRVVQKRDRDGVLRQLSRFAEAFARLAEEGGSPCASLS